ncbi:IS4 family transposase [Streptomyces sp. NPDC048281]|uniref:IS4 family transposase n=1 Tax=Streptomyces sp. NPDC048281 TaxID=3154715 RepID=UPI00341B5615
MVCFLLAMCLFCGQSCEEVARLLTAGVRDARRWRTPWVVPSTAAIWKAGSGLGVAPLRELFVRVCRPVAAPDTRGAFCRGWRLTAIDGTTFDLPGTKANVEVFGRPPCSGRGGQDVGYPQLCTVGLVECGTRAAFGAAIGALCTGERTLARAVLASLRPGMLLLAGRGFYGVDLWRAAAATGADLLWRVRKNLVLPVVGQLPDGSYLTGIFDHSDIHHTRRGVPVRAVEYTIAGREGAYRLLTTILGPEAAPAAELAALYAQRWEFESALDEIKTRLGGAHLVLRSQHPDGAERELYGFLLSHHAIRHLMHQAARQTGRDPGPDLLHPLTARRAPPGHRPGGVFPPADSPAWSKSPTLNSWNASCHDDATGPTLA